MIKQLTRENFYLAMKKYASVQPNMSPDFEDEFVLDFWFEHLNRYSIEVLKSSFMKLCAKDRFPSIEAIKKECGDEIPSEESIAKDIADRIWYSIGRWGHTGWEDVEKHIGELGVKVIGGSGGWLGVCRAVTYESAGMHKAQWRESAKAQMELARKGITEAPKLPQVEDRFRKRLDEATKDIRMIKE